MAGLSHLIILESTIIQMNISANFVSIESKKLCLYFSINHYQNHISLYIPLRFPYAL